MKALIAAAAATATIVAVPAIASAQTQAYGSLGYGHHDLDDVTLGTVQGRAGLRFTPNLAVEAELAAGVKGDDTNVPGLGAFESKINHQAAIYGVGLLPLSPNTDLYARVGYGTTEVEVEGPGASGRADGSSWNYGVGAQHFFDDKNGLRADYTRQDFDEGETDVWSLGYVRKF